MHIFLKIPYAKSETHLYEVLENVCSRLNNYGSAIEKERSYFLRRVDYKNFVFSGYLEVNNPEKLVNYVSKTIVFIVLMASMFYAFIL